MNKKEKDLSLAFEDNLNKRLFIARFGTKGIYKAMKEELDLLITKALNDYKNSDDAARWIENKITEAITDHEAAQWKEYPKEKPEPNTTYWVCDKFGSYYHAMGCDFDKNKVIAFHPVKDYPPFKGKEDGK